MNPVAPSRSNSTGSFGAQMIWRTLAGAAVVLMALLGGSSVAEAHDSEEGSSPASGSTVATMPENVSITMTNTPAAIGAEIKVLDAAGTNWSQGPVSVLDNVASQRVRVGAPAGTYTVQWRLVSSDSHPVEDEFKFTTTASGSGSGAVAGTAQAIQVVTEAAAEKAPDTGQVPWSVVGLAGVLVGVVIALVVVAKRRLGVDD